jgi:hypothetical protein
MSTVENANGQITKQGTYLIPVVWNKRLLVFFPQIVKKTKVKDPGNPIPVSQSEGKLNVPITKPIDIWEIKMGWSEYRNGKWAQKQVSAEAFSHEPDQGSLPDIVALYKFVPRGVLSPHASFLIDVYRNRQGTEVESLGAFHFSGSQLHKGVYGVKDIVTVRTDFHYITSAITPAPQGVPRIHSLESSVSETIKVVFDSEPYFVDKTTEVIAHFDGKPSKFSHPFAHELLGTLNTGNLDALFDCYLKRTLESSDPPKWKDDAKEAYGENGTLNGKPLYNELNRAYSLYNWEATFHAPVLLVDRLLMSQQFEQALKMCHYVFNPLEKGKGKERFWQFPPFKVVDAETALSHMKNTVKLEDAEDF